MLAENRNRAESFKGRDISATSHHHVGLGVSIVTCPFPYADALGAMLDGVFHGEPLWSGVLAGNYDVHIVAAAQTVVRHREQAVGVRRKIDAHDLGFFICDVIDKSRILVGEAVVILPPDMR